MNISQVIYTESNDCQDCYKCVRNCPVKAIKITNNCASVIDELCIACGKCVEVCPAKAKRVRSDVDVAKYLISNGKKVVLSLAPSWVNAFKGKSSEAVIAALKKLGFYSISETALGAEMVNRYTRQYLSSNKPGVIVSSACPVVVDLINKYYPGSASLILSVFSPMLAHAKYLKEYYKDEVKVVFAGPCIAKKRESDRNQELVSASITFQELQQWLDEEGIDVDKQVKEKLCFEPVVAVSGAIYPVEGGMIEGVNKDRSLNDVRFMSFSGLDAVKQVLQNIPQWNPNSKIFIELLACPGGCINGPSLRSNESLAQRQNQVLELTGRKQVQVGVGKELTSGIKISASQQYEVKASSKEYSDSEIDGALRAVGKQSPADELNCGGCGYDSCRAFAAAMLDGKAESNMCVSYMRRVAHDKATVLLQRMPSGVIIVDDNLKIVECNQNVTKMLGSEIQSIYDANPGMAGANIQKILPFYKLFSTVLSTGTDLLDKDVKYNGHILKISIFTIQPHKIVGAIIRDLNNPLVRSEEIVGRTKSVITENLETVQQIAYLLGENASRTETMLNSIMELFKENQSGEDETFSY